ncbi:MAG TPA: zinc ribbon domain-containing protein [Gammaproteobacteria bacterium]|nr:zinc ribbon domain-containing protein [Gammaproteobacteria bacterium]
MPIYEYKCEACGHRLEALQKLSDAALKKCPECGKPALHKQMSAAGFRLKGGGWYETDFKSGNKRNLIGEGDKPAVETKEKKDGNDKKAAEPLKETTAKKAESKPESKLKPAKAIKAE